MWKPGANSRVEKQLPTVATKLNAMFCMATVTSSKASIKWSPTPKCVSQCKPTVFCNSLFRAFRGSDARGGRRESVGSATVRWTSVLNESSNQGTTALPYGFGAGDANEAMDFILVADSIDTAFTDFATHEKFQVDFAGQHWSDSEAEFACLNRALAAGEGILDAKDLDK